MPDEPSCRRKNEQPPSLTIDWDAYLPFFEDEDISEEDKRALIEALWGIMASFVDLGFGIHPVQQICGKDVSLAEMPKRGVVTSGNTASTFQQASTSKSVEANERSPNAKNS